MPSKLPISQATLITALEKGVAYLAQTQRASGEFATYMADRPDMVGAKALPKSVYVTTFVIHALSYLPASPVIERMQQRAGAFLQQEQAENGAWNYNGRGQWPVPADLDDTCCALAALFKLGHRPAFSFYALLWQNEVAPGGPYYTWLGINDPASQHPLAREVDALVNANILFCAGLLNLSLPGTVDYLQQIIQDEAYQARTVYCLSPHLLLYALSRAYADGQVTALAPARPVMQNYILANLPPPQAEPVAFNLACLAASLLNLQAPRPRVEPYLAALLAGQQADGHWPTWAAYVHHNGAPALTTALALEAIGKYLLVKRET